jgi:hypothetical protein
LIDSNEKKRSFIENESACKDIFVFPIVNRQKALAAVELVNQVKFLNFKQKKQSQFCWPEITLN